MKIKLKKLITTTVISAVSVTAIGCSTNSNNLAKNINKGMADLVSSINNLDYVETTATGASNDKIGKIVETSSLVNEDNLELINTDSNDIIENINSLNVENTITHPSQRTNDYKLFILSDMPYISLTSDNNSANLNISLKFSTDKIQTTSNEIDTKINELILKRSILMVYVNEIYAGNVAISEDDKVAINAYVNVIKENATFLKGNRGMVRNQLNLASNLYNNETNNNLINYYMIKSGEALETRSSKIESTISAIDSIIEILENNLTESSPYYQKNLNDTYQNILNGINNNSSENKEIADIISESIGICENCNNTSSTSSNSNNVTRNQNNNTNTQNQKRNITNNNTNNQSNTQNISSQKQRSINNNTSKNNTNNLNSNRNISSNKNNISEQNSKFNNQDSINRQVRNNTTNSEHNQNETANHHLKTPTQSRTIRANRTPLQNSNKNIDDYTSAKPNRGNASRVPYQM